MVFYLDVALKMMLLAFLPYLASLTINLFGNQADRFCISVTQMFEKFNH